jgi:hypothetical protein
LVTKRILVFTVLFALFAIPMMAQEAGQAAPELTSSQKSSILREFSYSANLDGMTYVFVLLNDKSVEALFVGKSKDEMRTRANASTVFFVRGNATKDQTAYSPKFTVEQGGKTIEGEAVNIDGFKTGTVSKGAKIQGLIQFTEKIDLTQAFRIRGPQNASLDIKLSKNALKYLQN